MHDAAAPSCCRGGLLALFQEGLLTLSLCFAGQDLDPGRVVPMDLGGAPMDGTKETLAWKIKEFTCYSSRSQDVMHNAGRISDTYVIYMRYL